MRTPLLLRRLAPFVPFLAVALAGCANETLDPCVESPEGCGIAPQVTCAIGAAGASDRQVVFGYRSGAARNIRLPRGPLNEVTGPIRSGTQPEMLAPGTTPSAFVGTSETSWRIGGTTAADGPNVVACVPGSCKAGEIFVEGTCEPLPKSPEEAVATAVVDTETVAGTGPGGAPVTVATGITGATTQVTHTGEAVSEVSLWYPPGRAGIEPSGLSLRYSSGTGVGVLGRGWTVTPQSSIVRCGKDVARDGVARPIVWDNTDYFCLDGLRLVAVEGEYGADGTVYRTERDIFAKIVSRMPDELGPTSFEVRLKSGRILTYGGTADSRIEGDRTSFKAGPGGKERGRLAWSISKEEDRFSNYMLYVWSTKPDTGLIEHHLVRIEYTGHEKHKPQKSVVFDMEPLPGGGTRTEFVAGMGLVQRQRMKGIRMLDGTRKLREYKLRYIANFQETSPGAELLAGISECDGRGVCKGETAMGWEPPATLTLEKADVGEITDVRQEGASSIWILNVADHDGDGRDDIFYKRVESEGGRIEWFVRLSQGETFGPPMRLDIPTFAESGHALESHFVDLDLDGRADIAFPEKATGLPLRSAPVDYDSDGDGMPDALSSIALHNGCRVNLLGGHWPQFWRIRSNNGTTFGPIDLPGAETAEWQGINCPTARPFVYPAPLYFGDIDGDGLLDAVRQSYFRRFGGFTRRPNGRIDPVGEVRWGIRFNQGGRLGKYTLLARTEEADLLGFPPLNQERSADRTNLNPETRGESYLVDIDGSGRAAILVPSEDFMGDMISIDDLTHRPLDYVAYHPDAPGKAVSHSDASFVFSNEIPLSLPARERLSQTSSRGFRYVFADVNGDGLADAVRYPELGGAPSIALSSGGGFLEFKDQPLARADQIGTSEANISFAIAQPLPVLQDGPTYPRPSVQVIDVNADGRQDLVLLDAGCIRDTSARKVITYLESTGSGFRRRDFGQPIGDPADAFDFRSSTCRGYEQSRVLDVNGDGVLDIVQVRDGKLELFVNRHQPILLRTIRDAAGAEVEFAYKPYQRPETTTPPRCTYPQKCLAKGVWVVDEMRVTDGTGGIRTFRHEFVDGRTDVQMRQFLGFAQHSVTDVARNSKTDYELNGFESVGIDDPVRGDDAKRVYPFAGLVTNAVTRVTTGERKHTFQSFTTHKLGNVVATGVYSVFPEYEVSATFEGTQFFGGNPFLASIEPRAFLGTFPNKGYTVTKLTFDESFGNLTRVDAVRDWKLTVQTITIPRVIPPSFPPTSPLGPRPPLPPPLPPIGGSFPIIRLPGFPGGVAEQRLSMTSAEPTEKVLWEANYENRTDEWLIGLRKSVDVTSTAADGRMARRNVVYVPAPGTGVVEEVTAAAGIQNLSRNIVYKWNEFGLLDSVTITGSANLDLNGEWRAQSRTTSFGYELSPPLFPTSVTNALGHTTKLRHDEGLGVLVWSEDPNARVTTSKYDGFGRPRVIDAPDDADLTLSYGRGTEGDRTSITRRGASTTVVTYDSLGRPVKTTRTMMRRASDAAPTTVESITTYDTFGRVATVSNPAFAGDPAASVTTTVHDELDRIVSSTAPGLGTTTYEYQDLLTTILAPLGKKREVQQDRLGRAVSVTDVLEEGEEPTTATTRYEYGPFDVLTKIVDAVQNETTFEHDDWGNRTALVDPDSGRTEFLPNAFGDVVTQKDAEGEMRLFAFDELGRLVASVDKTGGTGYSWDGARHGVGALDSTIAPDDVKTVHTYDRFGRPREKRWTVQGTEYALERSYDRFGRLESMTYPAVAERGRLRIAYGYSTVEGAQDQLLSVAKGGAALWTFKEQAPNDIVAHEALGNGAEVKRTFDPASLLLKKLEAWTSGAAGIPDLQNLELAYRADGRLEKRTDHLSGGAAEVFDYDALGRLRTWEDGARGSKMRYAYSLIGNLESKIVEAGPGETVTFAYEGTAKGAGPHAVTSSSALGSYRYNRKGEQIEAPGRTVAFTSFGLPKEITTAGATLGFQYDAEEQRVFRGWADGASTVAIGGAYEKRVAADGATTHVHLVQNQERVFAQIDWLVGGEERVSYLVNDDMGSPSTVVTGGAVERIRRDPWGTVIERTGAGRGVRLGFTGHEEDDDLGLVNMGGRIYDPHTSRFLTPDPIMSDPAGQGLDPYAYVRNDPVNLVDPMGFDAEVKMPVPIGPGVDKRGENGCITDFCRTIYIPLRSLPGNSSPGSAGGGGLGGAVSNALVPSARPTPGGTGTGTSFAAIGNAFLNTVPGGNLANQAQREWQRGNRWAGVGFFMAGMVEAAVAVFTMGGGVEVGAILKAGSGAAARNLVRFRVGRPVAPIEKTLEMALNPEVYIQAVVKKYSINLRGSGQQIQVIFNPKLVALGKVRAAAPNVIEVGPAAMSSEANLANTIAHELNHARSFLRGGTAPEATAYPAGDALEAYIQGLR